MSRRNIELALLCAAAPFVILLFALLAFTEGNNVTLTNLTVPLGIFVAFIIAHISVRFLAPGADPALLPLSFALSGIGIAFITRLAPDLATRQVIALFGGVIAMILVLAIVRNLDRIANYKYTFAVIGFALLLSPLLPVVGQEIYGGRIWLSIAGVSFQPGEIAKIAIVAFLAGYLASNREMLSVFTVKIGPFHIPDFRTILPLLIFWGIAVVIVVFEKDLGSALVFFCVFLAMLYVATGKKTYLVIALFLAAVAAVFLYKGFAHIQARVAIWLDPFADASGAGYQLVQSIFSMADGGLFGAGIGRGLCTLIPVVESDFIFAAIAEEMGLLGAAGVLLLYLSFAIRGMLTAARAKSDVSSFAAVGLTVTIVLQAFIIVGGVTRLIPLTGITLPFISQGGSSMIASFIAVGVLLRVGDEGTGVEHEMKSTTIFNANNVLGRVSLGKRLTKTLVVLSILFALLVANLTLIMVVRADDYKSMPNNNHTLVHEAYVARGTISTKDGVVLATSERADDGSFVRVYPAGDLASHVVGYSSVRFGESGIEAAENEVLQGERSFATWSDALSAITGSGTAGNDVCLTIDSRIQQSLQDALYGRVGAGVVIDPTTGAVLGLASAPTYNAADFEALLDAAASGEGAEGVEGSALFNRATQGLYSPGSTFKIVTLATTLANGVADESTVYPSPATIEIGNAEISNFDHADYGYLTLYEATALSSNTVYGQVGSQLGPERLVGGSKAFLFNEEVDFELPLVTSLMPDPAEMTEWETAWAAAGEPVGSHPSPAGPQATVLEMALVGCAIANGGSIMAPYLVDSIYNIQGERSYTANPNVLANAVSADIAERVREVLRGVIDHGTGTEAAIWGVDVAGKTGTAEKADGNDIWFVGIASANGGTVVVALVIENGEEGVAASLSQGIMTTALSVQGYL